MKTSTRTLLEMKDMYEISDLYTMHRGTAMDGKLKKLRYDMTTIPRITINDHLNKTKGHIHSSGHKEIYIVLEGFAAFLLQKGTGDEIEDVYAVMATRGESVIIPGDYHHITINTGRSTLKVGNWVHDECVSDYSLMEKMKGMCYYLKSYGPLDIHFHKNKEYKIVPKLRYESPLQELPEDLSFLL